MKCLDVGCGIGGPLREIALFSGAHVTGVAGIREAAGCWLGALGCFFYGDQHHGEQLHCTPAALTAFLSSVRMVSRPEVN